MLAFNISRSHFGLDKGRQVGKISTFALPGGKGRDCRCSRFEGLKSKGKVIYREGRTVLVRQNGERMMEGKQWLGLGKVPLYIYIVHA